MVRDNLLMGTNRTKPSDESSYRWVMLALVWFVYASFGMIHRSISPLITPIIADLQMTYSQMGLVLGSWQLTFIAAAALAGAALDKWGIRRSLFFGTIVMALSIGLRYFTTGFWTFLIVVSLFGIGGPMISVGCPKTISLWFKGKDRGTAVGIYMTGPWLGGAFALAATNKVFMPLTGHSWRLTFVCFGVLTISVALLWWFFAREADVPADSGGYEIKRVFVKLIRVRNVRILLLCGLFSFAINHGFTNWLPKILETKGLSPTMAGFASSIPLLAGIPALLIIPRFVPPHYRGRFIAWMTLVIALSTWPVAYYDDVFVYLGLALYGVSVCTLFPLFSLILMDTPEVGSRYMGSAGGIFFSISEIGGFMGPVAVGALVDWIGSFHASVYFVSGLSLLIFALTFLLEDQSPPESKRP